MRYCGKSVEVDIKQVTDDEVWYTRMSWKGERAHRAKLYDADTEPWFQVDGLRVRLASCSPT